CLRVSVMISSYADLRDLHSFPTRRSSDLRLTCYAGGQCCDDDAEPQHPFRHDRIKGICVSERCPVLRQEPRSLAEVVEQKADFHTPPPDTDVAYATMDEIGIQRFGTRSTEKDGTQYTEPT